MSRTDKDVSYKYDPDSPVSFYSSNFRKHKRQLKRQGNRWVRRNAFNERYTGRCPFHFSKTLRANEYYF